MKSLNEIALSPLYFVLCLVSIGLIIGQAVDLLTGNIHDFGGGSVLPPYSCAIWKMEH